MQQDPLKSMWQTQELPSATLSLQELHKRSKALQRRIRLRNGLEYLACLLVMVGFGSYFVEFPQTLMRIGSALVIAGTAYVAWQLHRRASAPSASPALPGLTFHRQQLERQRDALRSVWAWYVAPLVPGMVVFRWGVETQLDATAPFARGLYANLIIAAVLLMVVLVNRYVASTLQRQIDQLPTEA